MYVEYESMCCCGLKELNGVQEGDFDGEEEDPVLDPKRAIRYVKRNMVRNHSLVDNSIVPAHIIFSDAIDKGGYKANGGKLLAKYIRKHKLGGLKQSVPAYNKNSTHDVIVWIWTPDWKKIEKHAV